VLAVDTNILVRYVTRDDTKQSPRAKRLVDNNNIFVATTVLLETEWVLRSGYRFSPTEIVMALRLFAGLPRVTLEEPVLANQAFNWLERGMDFADAVHLAKTEGCEAFVSFDRRLAATARRVGAIPVRAP
jgi:predicted nucleic-acid-binding protein